MAWTICGVTTYRTYAATGRQCRGVVSNMATGEPRLFPTKPAAQSYAELSHFGKIQIEVHK